MGMRTDLLVTEEIAEPSDLRATPFEFERAKRVEAALSILEGKWKIVVLNRLFARPIWRFSELERAVPGISQRILSQQLRLLEKCELVKRTVHPQFPPTAEYELTEFGKTLCPAMKTLVDWAITFPRARETSGDQPRRVRNDLLVCLASSHHSSAGAGNWLMFLGKMSEYSWEQRVGILIPRTSNKTNDLANSDTCNNQQGRDT